MKTISTLWAVPLIGTAEQVQGTAAEVKVVRVSVSVVDTTLEPAVAFN